MDSKESTQGEGELYRMMENSDKDLERGVKPPFHGTPAEIAPVRQPEPQPANLTLYERMANEQALKEYMDKHPDAVRVRPLDDFEHEGLHYSAVLDGDEANYVLFSKEAAKELSKNGHVEIVKDKK